LKRFSDIFNPELAEGEKIGNLYRSCKEKVLFPAHYNKSFWLLLYAEEESKLLCFRRGLEEVEYVLVGVNREHTKPVPIL